jgi:hypothetical protein
MAFDFQTAIGDTGIDLKAILKSDVSGTQTQVDFSTYSSVSFFMWPENSSTMKVDGTAASFSDAANGEVTYAWSAGDVDTAGKFHAKFVCVNASDEEITFPRTEPGYFTVKIWGETE